MRPTGFECGFLDPFLRLPAPRAAHPTSTYKHVPLISACCLSRCRDPLCSYHGIDGAGCWKGAGRSSLLKVWAGTGGSTRRMQLLGQWCLLEQYFQSLLDTGGSGSKPAESILEATSAQHWYIFTHWRSTLEAKALEIWEHTCFSSHLYRSAHKKVVSLAASSRAKHCKIALSSTWQLWDLCRDEMILLSWARMFLKSIQCKIYIDVFTLDDVFLTLNFHQNWRGALQSPVSTAIDTANVFSSLFVAILQK